MADVKDKQLQYHPVVMGCDPELFFEKGGQIIGAEKVIGENGLSSAGASNNPYESYYGKDRHLVLDGVQVELNPNPHICRANMGNEIKVAFRALRKHLQGMDGIRASFRTVVELDVAELASLSEKSRTLGCAPSRNLYDAKASIAVDAKTYTKRSAGGHIHVGLVGKEYYDWDYPHLMDVREELVPLMDILVGLPSVMVDRDPLAPERRKVYGRAGEYRLPKHGVEYRTLSNFWLRSYQLMSLVFGLTRLAVCTLGTEHFSKCKAYNPGGYIPEWPAASTLLSMVDLDQVKDAINNNDLELARAQFQHVKRFLVEHVQTGDYGLNGINVEWFEHFCSKIQSNGLEYWFPQDPLEHWCNMPEGHQNCGWESFLAYKVALDQKHQPSTFKTVY